MAFKVLLRVRWSTDPVVIFFLFLLLPRAHCQPAVEELQTNFLSSDSHVNNEVITSSANTAAFARTSSLTGIRIASSLNDATSQYNLVNERDVLTVALTKHINSATLPYKNAAFQTTTLGFISYESRFAMKPTEDGAMSASYNAKQSRPRTTLPRVESSSAAPEWLNSTSTRKLSSNVPSTAAALQLPQAQQALSKPVREDGFNLFFRTNPAEMLNVPITFSNPLPAWVNGTLVRNGLGKFENGPRKFLHAFDGYAKLASWRFTGNETALFSTKFIRSNFFKDSRRAKTIAPYLLFQSVTPPFSYYEKLQCLVRGIDNMNVNFYAFKNPKNKKIEYAALSDFWIVYKISLPKLSTKHRVVPRMKKSSHSVSVFRGMGFLNLLSSAHPLPEPGTNNHITFLSSVAFMPWDDHIVKLIRIKSLKRRRVIAQWPVKRIPYMHSFSVTRTKAILLASPFLVNVMCMASKAEPFSCLDWHPDQPTHLYIVDLKSGNLTTIVMETVFTMHHVNAYDVSDTEIAMDISTYPNPDFVSHLQLHVLKDPVARNSFAAHAKLQRITIDLSKLVAHLAPVDPRPVPGIVSMLDMPVINEAYRSRRYCFVYGLVLKADNVTLSNIAIVKKDLCRGDGFGGGAGDRKWIVPGVYPVEPWFVANPYGVEEDDGLLLVPVLDGVKKISSLVVLDAKTLTLVNSAVLPTIIPYSLHGRFFHGV